jgi:glucose-1-phosphate thymidylyltransferase
MSKTLGIILAGGKSTRLYPATFATTKQVLPIYDKPLIYYPLSTLMLAGIRDFVVITTPEEQSVFKTLLWDASDRLGINIMFAKQDQPRGIADAFNVVDDFLMDNIIDISNWNRFALILGDNIFYGSGMTELLEKANSETKASIVVTKVKDPERFGVVELNDSGDVLDMEEKPADPKSDLAITGLYFFDSSVFPRARKLLPSKKRNELEITDLVKTYLADDSLTAIKLLRGMIWFDTGTPESLLEAANLIHLIQKHQGIMVGNPHEIAYNKRWITNIELKQTALLCEKSGYGKYLLGVLNE